VSGIHALTGRIGVADRSGATLDPRNSVVKRNTSQIGQGGGLFNDPAAAGLTRVSTPMPSTGHLGATRAAVG
jgi:hypothetical protein